MVDQVGPSLQRCRRHDNVQFASPYAARVLMEDWTCRTPTQSAQAISAGGSQ
jgi:hypothetical protein